MDRKFNLEAKIWGWFRPCAVVCAALILAGCSVTAPFSAAPRLPTNSGSASSASDRPIAVPLAGPPPAAPGLAEAPVPRRQYYDQKRRKYYYFDPSKKAYFWEDGTPK